jgi:chromosomal replication initiation ATPase DnaA
VWRLGEKEVASAVASELGLKLGDLTTGGRRRLISRARHVAAYLGRAVGGIPVARMARYFGRDESTFVRGVLRLEKDMKESPAVRKTLDRIEATLRSE